MRPILLHFGNWSVGSYPLLMALAVFAGLATLAWRSRRRDVAITTMLVATVMALVGGWVGSRLGGPLLAGQWPGWANLLPQTQAGHSITGFLLGCSPAAVWLLVRRRREQVRSTLDVITPSLFIALALAKVGCLLAGCCYGRPCPETWGIHYPFGSRAYIRQFQDRQLHPPGALILIQSDGRSRLLPPASVLAAHTTSSQLATHASSWGLSPEDLAGLAGAEHSLPVWPVPVYYAVAAAVAWLLTEWLWARSARPGTVAGAGLVIYGTMRLTLEALIDTSRPVLGLSYAQMLALGLLLCGLALLIGARHAARLPAGDTGLTTGDLGVINASAGGVPSAGRRTCAAGPCPMDSRRM